VAREVGQRAVISDLPRAALAYAKRGVPVFPCEPGGKRPLTKSGFWDATVGEHEILAWWGRWPQANVAIPTGEPSGLMVLDVDSGEGPKSLRKLELEVGRAPETLWARTGGGGEHLFFRYPTKPAREARNSQGLLGPGLDVRAQGGYVLVAPSQTSGRYEWTTARRRA
jgi:hypothetical protein